MERNDGYYLDSEWPAGFLQVRWKEDAPIISEPDGTVFVTDEFGNVILTNQDTYNRYQKHLETQEAKELKEAA